MFGSAFPTLALSWCLAAGSSGMRVLLGPQPRQSKGTGITRAPPRGHGQRGNWGGDCPLKSFSGSGCSAPCRTEPWGCCSYFFPSGLLYFTLLGLERAVVTRGAVQPCPASLLCPWCPQPALGMARPGRGGPSKHPHVDPLLWDLWEVAGGGLAMPPWGPTRPVSLCAA